MRLFKRPPAPPPQLLRLSVLEEGVEPSASTAGAGVRLSLPSSFSECNLEDLMAGTEVHKARRGFPFPWLGRKHSAPKKYSVTSEGSDVALLRSAVSQLALGGGKVRYLGEVPYNEAYLSGDHNDFLNNNSTMYRSVSTSALFDEQTETSDGRALASSCEDLIDRPAEGGSGPAVALGTVLEEDSPLEGPPCHGDTESLASSIQHRSDESGYESDGTKNGADENPTAIQDAVSGLKGRERFYSLDSNVQRFAALFQRLTGGARDGLASPAHEAAPRSLRLRTPAVLAGLSQRPSPKAQDPPKTEDSPEARTPSSKMGQFKAWTLDRKLLRSRWKKNSLPDEKLDISSQLATGQPTRRSSIFQSSLFPEDSPPTTRQLETKSLPSLSTLSSVADAVDSSLVGDSLSNCGGLNYQLRLKKAGYRSRDGSASSCNNTRRRLWLQSQLSGSDGEDALSPDPPPAGQETPRRLPSQLDMHELVSVDLQKDEHGELGIYITGCNDVEKNVLGYIIMDLEKGGPAERSGKLLQGDELLIVNGQQLQGVSLEEARKMLRVPEADMHLLLARELSDDLCFKEDAPRLPPALPPVPELHESAGRLPSAPPRLRHWTSDVSSYVKSERLSHPDLPPRPLVDNERMGSNGVCTLPRRPKSSQLSLHTVVFEKGPGRRSLGFSIVGGRDSPKGALGFYVKTIFASGQAAETACLREGDEIYTLNGQSLQGLSHSEAIAAFKKIKQGPVVLHIGRRTNKKCAPSSESTSKLENNNSKSCSTLDNI